MPDFRFYQLTLSDTLNWCIGISEEISEWGDFFARLLELERCKSEGSQIIYIFPHMSMDQEMYHVKNIFSPDGKLHKADYLTFPHQHLHFYCYPRTNTWVCFFSEKKREYTIFDTMAVLFCIYYQVIERGGLLLHGALLFHPDYKGAALLAPGGTGKSTCAKRVVPPWSALSDDTFILLKDQADIYSGHPVPTWSEFAWGQTCDKTWNIEHSVPLYSLFFLRQGKEDAIDPLGISDAALALYESTHQVFAIYLRKFTKSDKVHLNMKIFNNACTVVKNLHTFELSATLHGHFWEGMEQILIEYKTNTISSDEV